MAGGRIVGLLVGVVIAMILMVNVLGNFASTHPTPTTEECDPDAPAQCIDREIENDPAVSWYVDSIAKDRAGG